jgi:hypothetical protein
MHTTENSLGKKNSGYYNLKQKDKDERFILDMDEKINKINIQVKNQLKGKQ